MKVSNKIRLLDARASWNGMLKWHGMAWHTLVDVIKTT